SNGLRGCSMRVASVIVLVLSLLMCLPGSAAEKHTRPFDIYFIDVEGGQATLMVTPNNESILIDTGSPDFDDRDAKRIAEALTIAGLKRLDYVIITHYHSDHVGGVPALASRTNIGTFVDHGPNVEDSDATKQAYTEYQKVLTKSQHLVLKPGEGIP